MNLQSYKIRVMKILKYALLLFSLVSIDFNTAANEWDTYSDTWVATDDLGREVFSAGSVEGADALACRPSQVGIFYYLWQGRHVTPGNPIHDITKILNANPDNPAWGNLDEMHWWGEPVLGYYSAGDRFVVAKHMQMLVDAGVDFYFFDTTNALIYDDVVESIMAEIDRRQALGLKTPKLCFMVHAAAQPTVEKIYKRFYCDPKNDKYWFMWEGKPLLLGNKDEILATRVPGLMERFTFRDSWAWMNGSKSGEWAWLENYPQAPGWSGTRSNVEQIVVSTAQHATTKIGKSYHGGIEPPLNRYAVCDSTPFGLFYDEQWRQAHNIHPPVLMITQFNEWTAQRFTIKDPSEYWCARPGCKGRDGGTFFVDAYNAEFNRDIEPSRNPLIRDNYYLQTVSNIRRYKGVRTIPSPTSPLTIAINGDMEQWKGVQPEYRDDRGDILHQDTKGFNGEDPRKNDTGRNDIVECKVAGDAYNLYFYVETSAPITPIADEGEWMALMLNTDGNYRSGWAGYDFCVKKMRGNRLYLCANVDGKYKWRAIMRVRYAVSGCKLQLSIPRKALGVNRMLDFKWTDNIPADENLDILDFIIYGDVAPNGRFNYRYMPLP